MLKEQYQSALLSDVYMKGSLNVYDHAMQLLTEEPSDFAQVKSWIDQMAREKLINYADEERTEVMITNFGRYWIMNGGYQYYLRDGHSKDHATSSENHHQLKKEKEELVEARLKLTKYRLYGFWLALFISIIGFMLSVFNLYMLFKKK